MGIFGGGDNGAANEAHEMQLDQIRQNKAEIEQKRQSLYRETLDIVKGQGGQVWHPDREGFNARNARAMPKLSDRGRLI